jgi:hypothetical protein
MSDISSSDDIINVENITNRVDELREERDDFPKDEDDNTIASKEYLDWEKESGQELDELESLLSDLCGYGGDHQWEGDWYPATLIAEGYFTEYAEDFAIDIGAVKRDAPWPNTHIDWEAAAEDLKSDYSEVDFDGSTYFYRG